MLDDEMLTIEELAAYLKLKPQTIYKWAQSGKIPGAKFGKEWRFRRSSIERWIDRLMGEEAPQTRASSASSPPDGPASEVPSSEGGNGVDASAEPSRPSAVADGPKESRQKVPEPVPGRRLDSRRNQAKARSPSASSASPSASAGNPPASAGSPVPGIAADTGSARAREEGDGGRSPGERSPAERLPGERLPGERLPAERLPAERLPAERGLPAAPHRAPRKGVGTAQDRGPGSN